jgi:hypothetical protein
VSTSGFFHQTIPSGPLIHRLKHFWIWLRIRKVIWQSRWLSSVNDTAQAAWAVSLTPLRPPKWYQWHCSSCLSGINDTAKAAWAVAMTLLRRYDTAQARDLEFERVWPTLKGISIQKNYIGKVYYPIAITITQKT